METLSDKIIQATETNNSKRYYCEVKDVKQFIKDLKEEFPINCKEHHKFHLKIDKLAGSELTKLTSEQEDLVLARENE